MALQSMTGFARIEGFNEIANWRWEVRSLNGKGLDFRLRLPAGSDALQPEIRKLVAGHFKRGNLQITLDVDRPGSQSLPVLNLPALESVMAAISSIQGKIDCPPPAAEQILRIKGVMETGDIHDTDEDQASLNALLIADFKKLLQALEDARTNEGLGICDVLHGQLNQMAQLTRTIEDDPSRSTEHIKQRLAAQLALLLENSNGFEPDRLHQEAAILATRADLTEELDRLKVHVDAARQLLTGAGPVGRKLEFICQELNRECNTICSKSNAVAVTNAGLDMKVVIDQIREQVQNLE